MDRLSALDTEFLHLEDGTSHMHIGGMSVFDGSPPSEEALGALLAAKLGQIPRYRQHLCLVPLGLGRPVWADDPAFDLTYHVRATRLVEPTEHALSRLMGRIMAQELDRTRPLWEAWIVHDLPDQRWALISKVHHCMVDGVAGVGLLEALLDIDADAPAGAPAPWEPRRRPNGPQLVLDAWGGVAREAVTRLGSLPAGTRHPWRSLRTGVDDVVGFARLVSRIGPTRQTVIDGTIGQQRAWAHASAAMDDVKRVRSAFGGTVNDVVVTAVAGGFRELLLDRGEDVTRAEVRTLIPVSVRHPGDSELDNHVSAILYTLPVEIADSGVRLHVVREALAELKSAHMADAGQAVAEAADLLPPILVSSVTRLLMRISRRHPQHSLDTVTTNVPGPQFPLFCLGRRMLEHRPFVPITHGVRTAVAILSYDGSLSFGVTGDLASVPDVARIADGITATVDELVLRSTNAPAS